MTKTYCSASNICVNMDCEHWMDTDDTIDEPFYWKHLKDDTCGFRMSPDTAYNRCPTGGCEE
jgi:hypothetical protein